MSVTAIIFITFVGLLIMGAPITLSLGAAALGGMIVSGKPLEGLVEIAYTSVNSFPIMALPAFILSGALMESAGISRRLVAVAESLAGPFTGGMAASTILSCLFFGAISGSGPATTAAGRPRRRAAGRAGTRGRRRGSHLRTAPPHAWARRSRAPGSTSEGAMAALRLPGRRVRR